MASENPYTKGLGHGADQKKQKIQTPPPYKTHRGPIYLGSVGKSHHNSPLDINADTLNYYPMRKLLIKFDKK